MGLLDNQTQTQYYSSNNSANYGDYQFIRKHYKRFYVYICW